MASSVSQSEENTGLNSRSTDDLSDFMDLSLNEVEIQGSRHQPVGYAFEPRVSQDHTATSIQETSAADVDSDPDYSSVETADRTDNTRWCTCGNCSPMPTIGECVCCQEITDISHRLPDPETSQEGPCCIIQNPRLATICLDTDILDICLLMMSDVTAETLTRPIASR